MRRVAGVLYDPLGFPCTPPGVDVLEGGNLTSIQLTSIYENHVLKSAYFRSKVIIPKDAPHPEIDVQF